MLYLGKLKIIIVHCGRRIMVITLDFQSKDDGSIPFARSILILFFIMKNFDTLIYQ